MNKKSFIIIATSLVIASSGMIAHAEDGPDQKSNISVSKDVGSGDGVYSIQDEGEINTTIRKLEDMEKLEKARLKYNKSVVASTLYEKKMENGDAVKELEKEIDKKNKKGNKHSSSSPMDSGLSSYQDRGLGRELQVFPPQVSISTESVSKPSSNSVSYGPAIDVNRADIINFKKRITATDRTSGDELYLTKGDMFHGYRVIKISLDSVTFKKGNKTFVRVIVPIDETPSQNSNNNFSSGADSSGLPPIALPTSNALLPPRAGAFDNIKGLPSEDNLPRR